MKTKSKPKQDELVKVVRRAAEYHRKDGDLDVPTHYEVNVAVQDTSGYAGRPSYRHLFATHERSVPNSDKAAELLALFKAKFPAPRYHVSLTAQYAFGRQLGSIA